MAVEGKTILQTTERTELTGKEGIPFQYGTQNGHMLLEKIKEYISSDVYICPGAFQTTEGWSTTDVESIVGNWDEFTKSVSGCKVIITNIYSYDTVFTGTSLINQSIEGYSLFIMAHDKYFVYLISEDVVTLLGSDTVLFAGYIEDNLNSLETKLPLSANQGRILNKKISEISNPASAEKNGLMSKEDKAKLDGIQFNTNENCILFGEKKYGATLFKNVFGLSTSSSNEEIKTALGGNTYDDILQMVNRGILFLNINNKALQHVMIRIENKGSSEGDYLHIQGFSDASDTAYMKIRHYSGSFNITENVKRDKLLFKSGIVNELVETITDLPLSAAMGKKLQDEKLDKTDVVDNLDSSSSTLVLSANQGRILNRKMFTFSGTIHEGMTAFEENFYEIDEAIDEGALFTGVVEYGGESYKIVLASYRSENVPPFVSYKFVSSVFGNGIYCVVTATKNANQGGQLGDFTVEMVELPTKQAVSGFQSEISALKKEIEALKGSGA